MRALLATQMFPAVASAIPLYLILDALQLLNTRTGLVALLRERPSVPFAIFQLRGAFEAIPVDLEEAAMVDGATRFAGVRAGRAARAAPGDRGDRLFAFMSAYNEFILAATLLDDESASRCRSCCSATSASTTRAGTCSPPARSWSRVPVMALFYVAQRHLVAGLTAGGVKG